jgi:diacylglycerol kinase (ATP)
VKPPLLIVNPACGANDKSRALPRALDYATRAFGELSVRQTTGRGDARRLAWEGALEDRTLIVAVGGDGTFSEVVDGVMAATAGAAAGQRPQVGLINIGTGGDFRRSVHMGVDPETCVAALASGSERILDVGRAKFAGPAGDPVERHFVNVLSAGLGGLVDHYVENAPAFLSGRAAYYLASLRSVLVGKEQPLLAQISWEDETREEEIPVYLIAVCNGRWFGGGMDIAPMATPDDGRLEVITITERNRLLIAAKIRRVYSGRHLQEPTVHHFPCRRLELSLADKAAERGFLLDVDGDPLGSLPLSLEVLPGAFRMRA